MTLLPNHCAWGWGGVGRLHCTEGGSLQSLGEWEGGTESLLFCIKASRSIPYIHGVSCLTMELSKDREELSVQAKWVDGRSGEVPSSDCPGWVVPSTGVRQKGTGHLQALLSSTLTVRGLIAPVRFIWEVAEGASCSFMVPRLGFSSTRFAFG